MRNLTKAYLADHKFHRMVFHIALPITLQMILTNGLSFVDTMMIGRLGEVEVAAVGLANQMFFLVFLIFFGITSGTGIFVAQYWGDRDVQGIHKVMGLSLIGVLLFSIPFALVSFSIPKTLMRLFSPDAMVVAQGAEYLRIIAPSYIFSGISFAFAMGLRSIERPRIPLLATAISMSLNTVLNLILIFGMLGAPALGVRGAAIATCISRAVELVVILSLIYGRKMPVAASVAEYLNFDQDMIRRFIKTAGPVLMNEVVWSLGMVVYKVVYARMGTDVIAAANVTEAIQGLFFTILTGTGNTSAIMIGKKIGEKQQEEAEVYGRYFLIQSAIFGLLLGVLMAATAPLIVRLLKMDPSTVVLVRQTLLALAVLVPLKSINIHLIIGILRSGGDTTFAFLSEFVGVWAIGVPMAILSGLVFRWPLPYVCLLVGLEEIYKWILMSWRFVSGKWLNDLTRSPSTSSLDG